MAVILPSRGHAFARIVAERTAFGDPPMKLHLTLKPAAVESESEMTMLMENTHNRPSTCSRQAELSEGTQAYFDKCVEKLGLIPNVLLAYAFDEKKLRAFTDMYNELMLGESGLTKLEREMIAVAVSSHEPLLLLPDRAWRGGAAVVGRSGAGRDDGDELSRRRAFAAPAEAMLGFAVKLTEAPRQDRGSRSCRRCGLPASPTATSGTSPRRPPSSTCRTGWRPPSICGPNAEYHAMAR